MKKLAVLFPGAGYGKDCPLLYYADFVFEVKGYERKHMDYGDIMFDRELSLEQKTAQIKEQVWKQAERIDFDDYDEIVFISKSIGTVVAGWLADYLKRNVRHMMLTPLQDALPYCNANSRVVIGTKDSAYPACREHCGKHEIAALYIDDANHSLEVEGKPYESIDALKRIMEFIEGQTSDWMMVFAV